MAILCYSVPLRMFLSHLLMLYLYVNLSLFCERFLNVLLPTVMMEESKLTNFQRRKLQDDIKSKLYSNVMLPEADNRL